ncbi:MAG: ATP-binding protein [Candidatus Helarchaeota archaeon]
MIKINIKLLLATLLASFLWAKNYPWILRSIYEIEARRTIPVDIDNDGVDELLICFSNIAHLRDQQGEIISQINFPHSQFFAVGAYDLNRIPFNELVFCIHYGDTVCLEIVSEEAKVHLCRFYTGKDISKAGTPGYDSWIICAKAGDLNNNSCNELICGVSTGFDLFPRGILVYDYKNNRELWHYWFGGNIFFELRLFVGDINQDNKNEIIFGTSATSNGSNYNGIDDFHSWVVALSSKGKLMWRKQIGGSGSSILIWCGDLFNVGKYVVIACEHDGLSSKQESNKLLILDACTGEIQKYIATGDKFMGMCVCDYNRDNNLEILTGNSDGVLRIFDQKLNLVGQYAFGVPTNLCGVEDLDGDGTKEIVLTTSDSRIIILNEKLDIQCDYKADIAIERVYLLKNKRKFNFLLEGCLKENWARNYKVYEIKYGAFIPGRSFTPFVIAGLIFIFSGLIYITWAKSAYQRRIRRLTDEVPFAVIILDRNNRVVYTNYQARNWFGARQFRIADFIEKTGIKKMISEESGADEISVEYNIDSEKRFYQINYIPVRREKLLIIIDRTQERLSSELISWAGFAQRLAHEIKNPLSTINLTLQRIQHICKAKFGREAKVLDQYTDSILEEVARLRNTTDKFMRILSIKKPEFTDNDLHGIIETVLQKYEKNLPRGVKVKRYFAEDISSIKCDQTQLSAAFSNLVENALEAIGSKGVLTIRTAVVEKIIDKTVKKYAEIKFEDTGRGMSEQELANLFKPFESNKPGGTGLGLVITRSIIEQHQGQIKIESKEGIGTVVTILLPI